MSAPYLVIRDTSPLVIYGPPLSSSSSATGSDLSSGWVPYYTQSGFISSSNDNSPLGTSQHITALDGAKFTINWNGILIIPRKSGKIHSNAPWLI
jgi:hypothetical protein